MAVAHAVQAGLRESWSSLETPKSSPGLLQGCYIFSVTSFFVEVYIIMSLINIFKMYGCQRKLD